MLYIVYQEDVEDSAGLREIHKPAHFAYLDQWKDKLVLGGAMFRLRAAGIFAHFDWRGFIQQ